MSTGNEIYDSKIKEVDQLFIYTHEEMEAAKEERANDVMLIGVVMGVVILFIILIILSAWHPEIVKYSFLLK